MYFDHNPCGECVKHVHRPINDTRSNFLNEQNQMLF